MKRRILFVDDEHHVLEGLRRMLREQQSQWDMRFAHSAFEAIELLTEELYDVVVSDIKMPDKDGLELLSEIKANDHTQNSEVIILTGLQDQDLKRRALDLGAADLLNKPVQKDDLIARLNSIIRLKSYQDDLKAQNTLLEQQLLQSQRMEVIGSLARGIAHDLNNILTIIVGYSDFAAMLLAADSKASRKLDKIKNASERAQKLVQQVLNFSRQLDPIFEPHSIGPIVDECLEFLGSSIPPNLNVEWEGTLTDHKVRSDTTQIYQLLLNLCINAVQAMEQGGSLKISLTETEVEAGYDPTGQDLIPGTYLKLEISDTGEGMDSETQKHIFDPLFSTKKSREGSGLGLAVVHRIVRNHHGAITVESSPNQGTTFRVYLPAVPEKEGVEQAEYSEAMMLMEEIDV